MKMKFIISFALIIVLAVCQVKSQSINRIIGPVIPGSETRDVNNVALFDRDRPNIAYCSGAVIGYQWIVTAASCVYKSPDPKVRVKVGGKNIDLPTNPTDTQFMDAETVIPILHPQYNDLTLANDIALLKLPTKLEKNSVLPYTLALKDENWVGKRLVVRGFGGTESYGEQSGALTLTEMRTSAEPFAECRKEITNMPMNKICSSTGRLCVGDQGGPVTLEGTGELIAIVSTPLGQRDNCGTGAAAKATFTNIITHKPWLRKETGLYIP